MNQTFPEHVLVGWACILRLQPDTTPTAVPDCIQKALQERGWIEWHVPDGGGYRFTDAGWDITDLHCPDWGIGLVGITMEDET